MTKWIWPVPRKNCIVLLSYICASGRCAVGQHNAVLGWAVNHGGVVQNTSSPCLTTQNIPADLSLLSPPRLLARGTETTNNHSIYTAADTTGLTETCPAQTMSHLSHIDSKVILTLAWVRGGTAPELPKLFFISRPQSEVFPGPKLVKNSFFKMYLELFLWI